MDRMLGFHGLPKPFYVIWIGTFINALGGFVTPFLAMYLTASKGFSLEFTGIVSGLIGIGMFLAGPLGGHASDHIGRRKVLSLSLVCSALTLLLLGYLQSKLFLAAIGLTYGIFSGMFRPVASATVADIVEKPALHRAYGLIYWAINIGFAIASSLAGYFATKNFHILFVIDATITMICAFIVWCYLPETWHKTEKSQKIDFVAPFKDSLFVKLLFLHLFTYLIFLQATVTFPIDLLSHGISPLYFGYLTSLNGLIIVVFQPLLSKFFGRTLSPVYWLAISALLYGVGFGLNVIKGHLTIYILGVIIWSIAELVAIGFAPLLISNLASKSQKGSYLGTFQMSWGAAVFLAPVLGSFFMARFGSTLLWTCCFAIGLFACISYISIAKQLKM